MMSPCKDCENRTIDCHDNCAKYLEYRKALDEQNKIRYEAKEKERIIDEYTFRKVNKLRRK